VFANPGGACSPTPSGVFSGGSLPVAATINQQKPGTALLSDYEGIAAPGQVVYVPLWKNQPGTWTSGLGVQNSTGQSATVTLTFYDMDDNVFGSVTQPLGARAIYVANGVGAAEGSVVVTADRPVAVAVNHVLSISGDGIMSVSGDHR